MATDMGSFARASRRLKPLFRRAVDRVAQPYVDQAVDRVARLGVGTGLPAHFSVLAETLHEARTLALADVPKGARTMLSAGAAGAWYFEWVDTSYGHVARHIGVEAFSPQPDALPDNVEWIAADIAGPDGIPAVSDHSVDLVFSGQNVEHLWPSQMVGFFVEANRVLADGGLLVVDSPNRAITAAYGWSMGEHTVEMTPAEMRTLLTAAGFHLEAMRGVWLCRARGELLPLVADPTAMGAAGIVRRFALATARPDDSFIWWAEARRTSEPDPGALERLVGDLFAWHWPERVARVGAVDADVRAGPDGRRWVHRERGAGGTMLEGPSMPLPAGDYRATIDVAWDAPGSADAVVARLEMHTPDGRVLGRAEVQAKGLAGGSAALDCPFTLESLAFGVTARLVATGSAAVHAPLSLSLAPEPWRGR